MSIVVPVSLGELVDKISILKIKSERISNEAKLEDVRREHHELVAVLNGCGVVVPQSLHDELYAINSELWEIEDDIRVKEKQKEFDEEFIALARSVYVTNDKRFDVKSKVNELDVGGLREQKSYEDYNV